MQIYLIKRSTMGGSEYMHMAYLSRIPAQYYCSDHKQDFISYSIEAFSDFEEISNNRVIINNHVYKLIRCNDKQAIIDKAMSKLNDDEKIALGLL